MAGIAISTLADGRFIEVNQRYCDIFGYSRQEIIGKTSAELALLVDQKDREAIADTLRKQGSFEGRNLRMRAKNGAPINVLFSCGLAEVHGQQCLISSVMDVTALLDSEAKSRRDTSLFEAILESVGEGIVGIDMQGNGIFVNPAACHWLGYTSEELVGQPIHELIHHSRPDGSPYPIAECPAEQARLSGVVSRVDDDVFWQKGGKPLPVAHTTTPMIDNRGEKLGSIITFRSIREEKERRQVINNQLMRLETLRRIDQVVLNSRDMEFTMNSLLGLIRDSLDADAIAILLLDPIAKNLKWAGGTGFIDDQFERSSVRMGVGQAGLAALEKRALHIPDLRNDETFTRDALIQNEGFISYFNAPLVANGNVKGVVEVFFRDYYAPDKEWLSFLSILAGQAAIAVENLHTFAALQRSNNNLSLAYDQVIIGWSQAMDLRDHDTQGHTQRVADLAMEFSRRLGFNENAVVDVWRGALLHDIGKIGVPDQILLKPGKLDDGEMTLMQQHARLGFEMLRQINFLSDAIEIVHCHHEKWDGSGYPQGLRGHEIPRSARLFALIDVYDALTSNRPYREAWTSQKALDYIESEQGKHFDPAMVGAFKELIADTLR